jgi:type I restriction enzyme, R subunit
MNYESTDENIRFKTSDKDLSEDDTRVKLFDPKLKSAGWIEDNIRRNFYITKGKVIIEGDITKRGKEKFADYVLFHNQSFPIAVIEAKRIFKHPADGISQAKEYAEYLNLPFAYSTNGHGIEEFDFSTNKQISLTEFPSPDELYQKWGKTTQQEFPDLQNIKNNPLLQPLYSDLRKSPRYYQLTAINKVLEALLKGQKKVLLTMATGTGKTYVASQIVYKLWKTGYLKKVLYLTDRAEVLRDQAYNEFKVLGDARDKIIEGKTPRVRDIYFATYQTLFAGDENKRLYQEYPADFFEMVIIDECHRSGWGRWNEILKYFNSAIHLGMTATPKRDDNIDTYAYFGDPVYKYEITQGIEDGYLANYLVQRIYTNIDKSGGISIKEASLQGAEIYYPVGTPEETFKDYYSAASFEKEISIPDRTKAICRNLAGLLEKYGPKDKTIVYCVSTDHAEDVKRELQNHFSHFGSNYAVRIVAEDKVDKKQLEIFKDSEKTMPVLATTVDLLTTGVDIPSVKNIVFMRTLSSVVLFNQIIGRGTRIDEASGKYFFRIIDYTGATKLFDKLLPKENGGPPIGTGPFDYFLKAQVLDEETGLPVENAQIIVIRRPNEQILKKTDKEGMVFFDRLPRRPVKIIASATGYIRKEIKEQPSDKPEEILTIILKKDGKKKEPIIIDKVPVHIETEEEILIEVSGKLLEKAEYIRYSRQGIKEKVVNLEDLRKIWVNDERRAAFLQGLSLKGISPSVISSVALKRSDIDGFDVLANVAFDAPIISRDERARRLIELKQRFILSFSENAQEIILDLIDQYRIGGIGELQPEVLTIPRFARKYGGLKTVIYKLKQESLTPIFNRLKENIYSEATYE